MAKNNFYTSAITPAAYEDETVITGSDLLAPLPLPPEIMLMPEKSPSNLPNVNEQPQTISPALPQVLSQTVSPGLPQAVSPGILQAVSPVLPQAVSPLPQTVSVGLPQAVSPGLPPQAVSPGLPPQAVSPGLPPQTVSPVLPQAVSPGLPPQAVSPGLPPQTVSPVLPQAVSPGLPPQAVSPGLPPQTVSAGLPQTVSPVLSQALSPGLLPQAVSPGLPPQTVLAGLPQTVSPGLVSPGLPQTLLPQAAVSPALSQTLLPQTVSPALPLQTVVPQILPHQNFSDDIDGTTEKHLAIHAQQWKLLTEPNDSGKSKFDKLCFPFSANPNVRISIVSEPKPPHIVFVGKGDAIDSAYEYFKDNLQLKCELPIDKIKWIGLIKLRPNLLANVCEKYGCSLCYVDGVLTCSHTSDISQQHLAIREVEEDLTKCFVKCIQPAVSPVLLKSIGKRLEDPSRAVVIFNHEESQCLCSESESKLAEAVNIIERPIVQSVNATADMLSRIKSEFAAEVHKIEHNDLVEVSFNDKKILIKGYTNKGVSKAKGAILGITKGLKQAKEHLSCAPPICAYIHHILFERKMSDHHQEFLSSLEVKVTTENNTVLLVGPSTCIAKEEEKLIDELVPKTLKHAQYEFSCSQKFIPQIEKHFLAPLHQKCDFIHLVSCQSSKVKQPSSAGTKRRDSSESEEGFTIFLFSTDALNFDEVMSSVKELNPGTVRFQIPLNSTEYVTKRKNMLEKKHCVRIFISKHNQKANVILHGLKDDDIASCKNDIEQTVFTDRKFPLTQQQLLYLRNSCKAELEQVQAMCHKVSLPPVQSESKNPFVLIKGKEMDVEVVWKKLEEMVAKADDYKVEIFSLKCIQCMVSFWKKRWLEVVKTYKDSNVSISFEQSEGPSMYRDRERVKLDTFSVINFKIRGSSHNVDDAVNTIKQKEGGGSIQIEIKLPSPQKHIHIPTVLHEAQLKELNIWLFVRGNKMTVLAPSFAEKDLEIAKEKLSIYFEEGVTVTESVTCFDQLTFDIMLANHDRYLTSANAAGEKNRVKIRISIVKHTISLEGARSDVSIVRPIVENALQTVKKAIQTQSIHVSSIQAPFLKTRSFNEMCNEIRKNKCVEISRSTDSNVLLLQAQINEVLKLLIISGDILAENVDAVVNAANEDLAHIGGLAKAISDVAGPEVQKECNMHVSLQGRVLPGNVACLGPGTLPCKNIIHAVAPRFTTTDDNVPTKLYNAVKNSLLASQNAGHSSIAIPALGTGIFAVPISICAEASIRAVHDFSVANPFSCLKDVRFILNSPEASETFVKQVKQKSPQATQSEPQLMMHSAVQQVSKPSMMNTWKWMDDSRQFQPYDIQTCETLSTEYKKNPFGSCSLTINGTVYSIDFSSMEQTNSVTKHKRKIVFQNTSTSLGDLHYNEPQSEQASGHSFGGGKSVEWYYKGDSRQWEPYLPQHSSQLENWYKLKESGTLLIGKHQYNFDFEAMTQNNVKTKTAREIKRVSQEPGDEVTAKWFFQNDLSEFQPYSTQDSSQLEEWYQSSAPGRLTIFGNVYKFDFTTMQQTNISTGKVRKIKREGNESEGARKSIFHGTTLRLRGEKMSINAAERIVQLKLRKCLISESETLPKSVKFSSIQRVARHHPVECSLEGPSSKPMVKITGVQFVVSKCITEIKSAIISNLESVPPESQIEFPKEWQEQQETVELFPVQVGTSEWHKVTGRFQQTMTTATIVSVHRIQNRWLWEKYAQHKVMLSKKNKGAVNEKELFHGTRSNEPKNIYSSEEGFDMRFSARGMWGQANYFAVNASYSDTYSYTNPTSGHQQMFLATVLTGDSYESKPDGGLRMPPEKKVSSYAHAVGVSGLEQVRYDTVTGNTNGSTVFMTYDNLKAYPAYIITYQRVLKRFGFF